MKAPEEIDEARRAVKRWYMADGLSSDQRTLLMGMSVALCWVAADVGGTTLQELVDGRPVYVASSGDLP
jgi:hypothetical protein